MTLSQTPINQSVNSTIAPELKVVVTPSVDAADYTLSSLIIQNNAAVNDPNGNIILYTLYNAAGTPASGSYILFSASSNVTFVPTYGTTNADSQFILHVTSAQSGGVLVTAATTTTPQVNNYTSINFTAIAINYSLTASITTNNAAANGTAANVVKATLINLATGQGVPGQTLLISTNGQANYPVQVTTDNYGNANITLSSYVSGNLTVTIRLQNNTTVYTTAIVTFNASIPNPQGPIKWVLTPGEHGVQDIFANFTFRRSHVYRVTYAPAVTVLPQMGTCQGTRIYEDRSCELGVIQNVRAEVYRNIFTELNIFSNTPETFPGTALRGPLYLDISNYQDIEEVEIYVEDITDSILSTDDISTIGTASQPLPDGTSEPVEAQALAQVVEEKNPDDI